MMKYTNSIYIIIVFLSLAQIALSQSVLTKEEAINIAFENNYDIKIANNNMEVAENNADILNSGYLPTLSASAGATYSNNNITNNSDSAVTRNVTGTNMSSNIALNYRLFDGMNRRYNFERLQEQMNLSELQARQISESTILELFRVYYQVARLSENKTNQLQTLAISRERLLRAKYGYEYGQNTQLDVLNAEVDFNTDSINYLNISQELDNVKRNLNVILARDVQIEFDVDTTINYMEGLDEDALLEDALDNNVFVMQNSSFVRQSEYEIGMARSGYVPRVDLNAGYRWQKSPPNNFLPFSQTQSGTSAGVTLSWNIFDGGTTSTRIQNSRISLENNQIIAKQTKQGLERDVHNAWGFYQNALFVLKAETKNLQTNERNFDRTEEQNKLGQITSIVFRQAQINLLNAKLRFNQAKYDAKIAELALLQLAGHLLEAEY